MKSSLKLLFVFLTITFTFYCSFAQGWQWSRSIGGPDDDGLGNIAVDNGGNLYVIGGGSSPYTIVGTDTLYPVGGGDFYIAKYDSSGNFLWSKQFGGNSDEGGGLSFLIAPLIQFTFMALLELQLLMALP